MEKMHTLNNWVMFRLGVMRWYKKYWQSIAILKIIPSRLIYSPILPPLNLCGLYHHEGLKSWTIDIFPSSNEQSVQLLGCNQATLGYGLPLLCGTHAFFPLPPPLENAVDIYFGKNI